MGEILGPWGSPAWCEVLGGGDLETSESWQKTGIPDDQSLENKSRALKWLEPLA